MMTEIIKGEDRAEQRISRGPRQHPSACGGQTRLRPRRSVTSHGRTTGARPCRLSARLNRQVDAVCRDFYRRDLQIMDRRCDRDTVLLYAWLNSAILDALEECCEQEYRKGMLEDLVRARGYRYTQLWQLSEYAYRKRKQQVKQGIARRLFAEEC